jgi:hypothetical protein
MTRRRDQRQTTWDYRLQGSAVGNVNGVAAVHALSVAHRRTATIRRCLDIANALSGRPAAAPPRREAPPAGSGVRLLSSGTSSSLLPGRQPPPLRQASR